MNVIVGIDGREQQADALALGRQLARIEEGRLTIAYVYPWSKAATRLGAATHRTIVEDAEALVQGARESVADVPVSTRTIADPSAARGLHRLAEEEHADVLVLGSCHRGPVGRALLGGVGERAIVASPCAVAVAPRGHAATAHHLRRIGVAYDASPGAREALAWASRLASALGGSVTVLSVFEPVPPMGYAGGVPYDIEEMDRPLREECRRRLDEAVDGMPASVQASGRMLSGPVAEAVAEAAGDVDLLVTGSRGYGPLRTVLLGSVSRGMLHHATCPVVVTPRGAVEHDSAADTAEARSAMA